MMTHPLPPCTLADGGFGGVILWSILIVGLLIAGFVAVSWVKRLVAAPDDAPAGGFSLGDLRQLHKDGQMSDEEFEKAKAMIVSAAQAAAAKRAQEQQQQGKGPPLPPGFTGRRDNPSR